MKIVDPVEMLRNRVTTRGDQKTLANEIGISQTYLCDLLAGRRAVAKKVLDYLGLERVVIQRNQR